jgi:vesicle-fusing ATPase
LLIDHSTDLYCFQAFGVSSEQFETFLKNGIITWSPVINRILDDGALLVEQTQNSVLTPLVTVLLEGKALVGPR